MIRDTFTGLAEEFEATAQKFLSGETVTTEMLLLKYSAILNYKARENSDKTELAGKLFDCALKLGKKAAEGAASGRYTPGEVRHPANARAGAQAILARLSDADSVTLLPDSAPGNLADVALDLIRKAEKLERFQFGGMDYENLSNSLTGFAQLALDYAAKFNAAQAAPDVTTSKTIPTAKPFTLKKEGPGGTP